MAQGERPRPTVLAIPPRARPPKAPPVVLEEPGAPAPAPPAPAAPRPTALPGVAPARVPVTAADLRRLAPGASAATVERALALVGAVVPDRLDERRAVLWGHDAQRAYAERAAEGLDLAGDPALEAARAQVARLLEILASLDPVAAARGGGGLLRALGGRADTASELARARAEIDHIVRLMAGSLDGLLALKARIERNAAALDALSAEGEAASLAALFLAGALRPSRPAEAERLEERAMSLAQMAAQLREHRGLREAQLAQPLRLVAAMQHASLVALPGLLGALAALGRNATPTEAGEAARLARDVAHALTV